MKVVMWIRYRISNYLAQFMVEQTQVHLILICKAYILKDLFKTIQLALSNLVHCLEDNFLVM